MRGSCGGVAGGEERGVEALVRGVQMIKRRVGKGGEGREERPGGAGRLGEN